MSEQTIQFLLNNGVAVAVLIATGWGVYQLAKVVAKGIREMFAQVAIPLKDSAIAHLEKTSQYLEKTSDAIDSLKGTLDRIDKKLPCGQDK